MNKQLFEDFIGDTPPAMIDVPAIVRRERRRRAVIRVGLPVTAALALTASIMLIGIGREAATESVTVAQPPAVTAPSATVASSSTGFRLAANDKAAIAATASTLRAALDAAVSKEAPGAKWLAQGLTKYATSDGQPPRIVGDDLKRSRDQMFTGSTGISLGGKRGTLALNIISGNPCTGGSLAKCPANHGDLGAVRKDLAEGLFGCQKAATQCTASTTKDGRRQRVQTSTSMGGFISHETDVELADGRALMLTVDNQFIQPGKTDPANDVAQESAPLTPAQVTAIATSLGNQILP